MVFRTRLKAVKIKGIYIMTMASLGSHNIRKVYGIWKVHVWARRNCNDKFKQQCNVNWEKTQNSSHFYSSIKERNNSKNQYRYMYL